VKQVIELSNLSKSFGDALVLDRINLSLASQQTHVLLGSSGCGKSTLLRVMQGLIPASSGAVKLDDIEVSPATQPIIAERVGYVIQSAGLFPHMSARRNICLMAQIRGWSEQKIQKRLDELRELVDLDVDLLRQYPRKLSGGQRQRVGLVRALFLNPDYLFFDEPLGALDPIIRASLQTELKQIFDHLNKTVVLVTHDITEAAYFGNTVTLFNAGRVEQHGSMPKLVQTPSTEFVSEFIHAQQDLHQQFAELSQ